MYMLLKVKQFAGLECTFRRSVDGAYKERILRCRFLRNSKNHFVQLGVYFHPGHRQGPHSNPNYKFPVFSLSNWEFSEIYNNFIRETDYENFAANITISCI